MAHELAHVQNRDTLTMTITATIAGAISMLANFAFFFRGNNNNPLGFIGVLVAMIVAPLAAMMVQMAISRTREYAADRRGAEISGSPQSLASALNKIAASAGRLRNDNAERNPATDLAAIDEVIFGCANQAGEDNRNVARMSLLLAGFPETVPGLSLIHI